jgi:hypothetical protein
MDESNCPMHRGATDGSTAGITQAEADSCCAMSEGDDSAPSTSAFVPVIALGPVVGPAHDLVLSIHPPFDARYAQVPLPGSPVPRHLLLSVFLI